jgi:hypothetical protein
MPTTYLDIADLDNLIAGLEQRWNVQSIDMLRDASIRAQIPEIVLLRWETFIRQRIVLREHDGQVRSKYLSNIPKSDSENRVTSKEMSELAA